MRSKQDICDAIMDACGRTRSPLGPGSKESREVLAAAYEHNTGYSAGTLSKTDLFEQALSAAGATISAEHYSTGNTITAAGLTELLAAVQSKTSSTSITGTGIFAPLSAATTVSAPMPLMAAMEDTWASQQKDTADTLMEFIDNSYTASLFTGALPSAVPYATVTITVDWDKFRIEILDNAGGMSPTALLSALGVGSPVSKPSATGLSGFGVGLKQAAVWLAGVNRDWEIESATCGSNEVVTLKKVKTPRYAIKMDFDQSSRTREPNRDPAPAFGFTRISITFSKDGEIAKRAMGQKVSMDDSQEGTYTEAIQRTLEFTYARYLKNAIVMRRNKKGIERVALPQKLSIDWVEIRDSKILKKATLEAPSKDLREDAEAADAWCQTALVPHWLDLADGHKAIGNHPKNVAIQAQLWWVAYCFDIVIPGFPPVKNIHVCARLADSQYRQMGESTTALKAVYEKYSRGTRIYYNNRLICVVQAPKYMVTDQGSGTANSLLVDIDVEAIEFQLYSMEGSARLLTSTKNAINLSGLPLTYMKNLESQIHTALGKGATTKKPGQAVTTIRQQTSSTSNASTPPSFWQWSSFSSSKKDLWGDPPKPSNGKSMPPVKPASPANKPAVDARYDNTSTKELKEFTIAVINQVDAAETWDSPLLKGVSEDDAKLSLMDAIFDICANPVSPYANEARDVVNEAARELGWL